MAMAEMTTTLNPGLLANNYTFVNGLRSALSKTETNLSAIVKSLKVVIEGDCWRHWMGPDGREYRWNTADFRQFIETSWPDGCGVSISLVRQSIRGSGLEEVFENLIRGEPGGPNNPDGLGGWAGKKRDEVVNRDNVTVDKNQPEPSAVEEERTPSDSPQTIPIEGHPYRKRDYSREAPTGNSVSYKIRRLSKERPDLYEKVMAGEMSAHGATVQAGLRPPSMTIFKTPRHVISAIAKHFQGEDLEAIIRGLAEHAGLEVVKPPA